MSCYKNSKYFRFVTTIIEDTISAQENDKENIDIIINSNLDGVLLQAKIFKNGEITKTIDGIAKDFGIEDEMIQDIKKIDLVNTIVPYSVVYVNN